MIANLKELSQTLFKHWFVDFEFQMKMVILINLVEEK